MVANNDITYYHKVIDNSTKLEKWQKHYFDNVWVFGTQGSINMDGYEKSNNVNIRIPMQSVENTNIFHIGDIVAIGRQPDIEKQKDLIDKEFYNVTSININNFGNNPHIHLGGK